LLSLHIPLALQSYTPTLINNIIPQIERLPDNLIHPTPNRIVKHDIRRENLTTPNRPRSLQTQLVIHIHILRVRRRKHRNLVLRQLRLVEQRRPIRIGGNAVRHVLNIQG
jgi:hypothetical protein